MPYEEFKEYMNHLQSENIFRKALRDMGIFVEIPQFDDIVYDEVRLLMGILNDEDNWIPYFLYDLDFGIKCEPNMIKDTSGSIKLETVVDLYDLLMGTPNYYKESDLRNLTYFEV